ncbi:MAG TPA: hypothetical protein VMT85_23265 [Thermoanaerobaculia bacterium]|nr:hypothetical protein [Thermoanaerobaculia bacterium]
MSILQTTARASSRRGEPPSEALRRRHLRIGWWALAVFATLGLVLESLHAFKVAAYVDAASETRRLLFRLGHAHGVMLSIVHLVWAFAGAPLVCARGRLAPWVSRLLIAALVLLPGGFLLGGLVVYGGDPGIGILLVPAGALLLIAAIVLTARAAGGAREPGALPDRRLEPRGAQDDSVAAKSPPGGAA